MRRVGGRVGRNAANRVHRANHIVGRQQLETTRRLYVIPIDAVTEPFDGHALVRELHHFDAQDRAPAINGPEDDPSVYTLPQSVDPHAGRHTSHIGRRRRRVLHSVQSPPPEWTPNMVPKPWAVNSYGIGQFSTGYSHSCPWGKLPCHTTQRFLYRQ